MGPRTLRESSSGQPETADPAVPSADAGRALVAAEPAVPEPDKAAPSWRPSASFVVQLIVSQRRFPQMRQRRRALPQEAAVAYRAADKLTG